MHFCYKYIISVIAIIFATLQSNAICVEDFITGFVINTDKVPTPDKIIEFDDNGVTVSYQLDKIGYLGVMLILSMT